MAAANSARAVALAALGEWRTSGRLADFILQQRLARSELAAADRAFAVELFYGVLRHLRLLDFWIGQLRSAPIDPTARDLLRLGLYQLIVLRTPGHAAVFETVALASARRRALVNARPALRATADRRVGSCRASRAARGAHVASRFSDRTLARSVRRIRSRGPLRMEQRTGANLCADQSVENFARRRSEAALPESKTLSASTTCPWTRSRAANVTSRIRAPESPANCSIRNPAKSSSTPAPRPAARLVCWPSGWKIAAASSPAIARPRACRP